MKKEIDHKKTKTNLNSEIKKVEVNAGDVPKNEIVYKAIDVKDFEGKPPQKTHYIAGHLPKKTKVVQFSKMWKLRKFVIEHQLALKVALAATLIGVVNHVEKSYYLKVAIIGSNVIDLKESCKRIKEGISEINWSVYQYTDSNFWNSDYSKFDIIIQLSRETELDNEIVTNRNRNSTRFQNYFLVILHSLVNNKLVQQDKFKIQKRYIYLLDSNTDYITLQNDIQKVKNGYASII